MTRIVNRAHGRSFDEPRVHFPPRFEWSDQALQRAEVVFSLDAVDYERLVTLDERHESCLDRGDLRTADRWGEQIASVVRTMRADTRTASLMVKEPTVGALGGREESFAIIPAPDRDLTAAWLFGTPPVLSGISITELLSDEDVSMAQRLATTLADPKPQLVAQRSSAVRRDLEFLDESLRQGLALRVGGYVRGADELVLVHLRANAAECRGLRVCEECLLVFEASRALRCPGCRKNPPTVTIEPWHTEVSVGDPATGSITHHSVVHRDNKTTVIHTSSRSRRSTLYAIETAGGTRHHFSNPSRKHIDTAARVAAFRSQKRADGCLEIPTNEVGWQSE
jgi:hypothetical protein